MPYPGFPTGCAGAADGHACLADGTSVFIETIFENRYKHAGELMRLGAKIKVEGRVAVVEGVPMLSARRWSAPICGAARPWWWRPSPPRATPNHLPDPFGQRLRGAGGLPGADRGGYPAGIMMVNRSVPESGTWKGVNSWVNSRRRPTGRSLRKRGGRPAGSIWPWRCLSPSWRDSGALAFMLLMLPGNGEASAEKPAVFGVHDIQVVGETRYSAEEIIGRERHPDWAEPLFGQQSQGSR